MGNELELEIQRREVRSAEFASPMDFDREIIALAC